MPFRFPGQYEDAETGLHYNRFRYYHPELGRYLSPDPLGQAASPNLYDYAGQSPTMQIDPLGLYRRVVHYDLTLELAGNVGIKKEIAEVIATANQAMDEDPETEPFNTQTGTWRHFRSQDAVERDLSLAVLTCNPKLLGQSLHSYQDTYSHAGFSWPGTLGHVPYSVGVATLNVLPGVKVSDPDDYDDVSLREIFMTFGTVLWLEKYWDECKCESKSK